MAKKELGTKFRRALLYNGVILLCLLFAIVSAVYSWFSYQRPNRTYPFDVNVEGVGFLKIGALKEWANENVDDEWRRNFRLKPVTGDGEHFFTVNTVQKEVVDGSGVYDEFPSETDFTPLPTSKLPDYVYRLDFNLQSNRREDLFLDYIEGKTFVNPSGLSTANISKYGEFSRDKICAAIRVAILQDNVIKCIWIPNTETELVVTGDKRELIENGNIEDAYEFRHAENSTIIRTDTDDDGINEKCGYTVQNNITYIWGDISATNCPKIGNLEYGENKMSILIWLEGTDRECDISMSEGRINANICFTTSSP